MIHSDAVVIGAGPVGLWTVFELGLLGISCHVVDTLSGPGGQCAALYADKPIYDIPGLPVVSGQGLTQALMRQIEPFQAQFHFGQQIEEVTQVDGVWHLRAKTLGNSPGCAFAARTVFIAGGVGAFVPKAPALDGLHALVGTDVWFEAPSLPVHTAPVRVCVLGGEEDAVQYVLALIEGQQPVQVNLVHRRDVFKASPPALQKLESARAAGKVRVIAGQPLRLHTTGQSPQRLTGIDIDTPADDVIALETDMLVILQGLGPKLGPLSRWGLQMARKQLVVDPSTCATSAHGIFAVGDIVDYPGKKKLIVSGFHEATQAAFAAAAQLRPNEAGPLQYTTSSKLLQQRLGVQAPASDT